ncbi:hypothetical protein ACHAQA_006808 [Verticillium albo-atrum]
MANNQRAAVPQSVTSPSPVHQWSTTTPASSGWSLQANEQEKQQETPTTSSDALIQNSDARPAVLTPVTPPPSSPELTPETKIEPLTPGTSPEIPVEYPSGAKLSLIVLALCLSVFVMALDNSIIATAIPKITDEFESLQDVGWYGSSYLLTSASLQLLFGKLYTFYSVKWIFLATISIFELGSLICGVAPNSFTLILGRAIAGVGSAGIFIGALIILAYSVPLARRPLFAGCIGSMYGISSVAGPLLGGFFAQEVTWRWCFYINLPIGAITVAVIVLFFPDPPRNAPAVGWYDRLKSLDPLGNLIFMPAIICLLLAMQWGGHTYAWDSGRIVALLMLATFLLLVFLYLQIHQQDNATVPPRIFKKRTIWSASLFTFGLGAAFLLAVYWLPIWFQGVKGATAVGSGVMNLPMLVSVVVFSLVAGAAVTWTGYYTPWMIASSVFMAVGFGLTSIFEPSTNSAGWICYQLLAGAGVGFGMQQPMIAVQVVLDMADVPTGSAIVIFLQTIGGAIFVTVGHTVFNNELIAGIREYVPGLDPMMAIELGATTIQDMVDPDQLPGLRLAYNEALTMCFLVSAVAAAVSIIGALCCEWKSVKGKKVEAVMA